MEKHFIEFLNIYFWVYIFSFIGYSLAYYLDDEYKKTFKNIHILILNYLK